MSPCPAAVQTVQSIQSPAEAVIVAVRQSPQVIAADSNLKAAYKLAMSSRATAPGQLTIAPWLGSPNGTTEEFLFIQSLDAGGRRSARVSSHNALILEAQATYAETLVSTYVKILTHVTELASAQRVHSYNAQIEKNFAESLRVIEAQVAIGTKPGSDIELAKAMWHDARINTALAAERVNSHRITLKAYGISSGNQILDVTRSGIPLLSEMQPGTILELRASASIAKLNGDILTTKASGRPDVSMVVRSQNFTRNFTPNDRGIAVQLSIPIDHGSIKGNTGAIASQIASVEARVKDDLTKQVS